MSDATIGAPAPASSEDKFQPSEHLNKLVMFCGHEKQSVSTDFGDATVAAVSLIAVLDGDDGVKVYQDAWVFGTGLAPSIYKSPMSVVVGVMGQGEAKPGKSAPWKLLDPSEAQLEAARTWFPKFIVQSGSEFLYKPEEAPF